MAHVAIVGAGITGITTAYALLNCGHRVTVFERQRYAAMETSFANGGQLSASNAEVWNHPSTLAKGLAWLFRSNAPLQLNPRPSWHKYSWLAEFVAQVPNYRNNTITTVRLALEARRQLLAIAEREGIDFDLERRGILHIYRDRRGFDHASSVNSLLQQGGLERHPVTPQEMKAIEPAINGAFYGGFYTPSDLTGDIHKFTRQLAAACERRGMRLCCDATQLQWCHSEMANVRGRRQHNHFCRCSSDMCRRRQPPLRGHAGRSDQHLSGQRLLDYGRIGRRCEPRCSASRQLA
jgi:D-amino-acid dehydrogenase